MSWTDERIEETKKLWQDGLSASQIAKQLGGVTRNAVLGKVHRLGLPGRDVPAGRGGRTLPSPRAEPARPSAPRSIRATQPRSTAICDERAFAQAATGRRTYHIHTCLWPIGEPGADDFHFCGEKAQRGAYCLEHGADSYRRPKKVGNDYVRSLARFA